MIYVAYGILSIYVLICWMVIIVLAQILVRSIGGAVTKRYAPFVPVPDEALALLKTIDPQKEKAIIYDLGCGDGKVLTYLAEQAPQAVYVGIEFNILPCVIAKIKTRNWKNISIKYKNFFKEDLAKADSVVLYPFPSVMDALLPKFERELKPGAMVYAFDYAFSEKEPVRVEQNKDASAKRGKRLFVYKFDKGQKE